MIKDTIYNDVVEHAKKGLPNETCGYLAGDGDTINVFYPMTNVDNSPDHFSFDPKEQFKAVKDARNNQLKIMAVYHSHPVTPARLSQEDLRLLNDPDMVYVIVSLAESKPDMQGYKIQKLEDRINITHCPLTLVKGD